MCKNRANFFDLRYEVYVIVKHLMLSTRADWISVLLADELTHFHGCEALRVLWSMTLAQSFTAGLNEWLSGWVPVWMTDFGGLYPTEEPWRVSWSVILDPELHCGRLQSPNNLWASPTRQLWLTAALIWNKTLLKERNCLNGVRWRGEGQPTKPAIRTTSVCRLLDALRTLMDLDKIKKWTF